MYKSMFRAPLNIGIPGVHPPISPSPEFGAGRPELVQRSEVGGWRSKGKG
jgi:hypothetical protein